MFPRSVQATVLSIRRPLVWLLAVAIVAYGHSAAMIQLLGPAHRHVEAAHAPSHLAESLAGVIRDLQAWRADLHARLLPHEAPTHGRSYGHAHGHSLADAHAHADAHSHAGYERHHHDLGDASVVLLDGMGGADSVADTPSSSSAGSAALPLAPPPRLEWPTQARRRLAWPREFCDRWIDAVLPPAERPPRA